MTENAKPIGIEAAFTCPECAGSGECSEEYVRKHGIVLPCPYCGGQKAITRTISIKCAVDLFRRALERGDGDDEIQG